MSSLFLRDDLAVIPIETGDLVELSGDEARHAVTVNRMRVGEHTTIGDGRGLMVRGVVVKADPKQLEIAVESSKWHEEPSPRLVLVQALAKGDRDELAVQAATELGVSGIIPWSADRSVSRWDAAKAEKGRARWSAIVREASKQSIRAWVPDVSPVQSSKQVAALGPVLVLDPRAEIRLTDVELPTTGRVHLVVGPEGGIPDHEFATLGGTRVRLGVEVLRTSTAGPAAIAVLNARLGRW